MMKLTKVLYAICFSIFCSQLACADSVVDANVEVSSVVSMQDGEKHLIFSVKNTGKEKVVVSKPGHIDSPIVIVKPNNKVEILSHILDRFDGVPVFPPLSPSSQYEMKTTPLEQLNLSHGYEVGIYKISLNSNINGKDVNSEEVFIYREADAPRITLATGGAIDAPEFVAEMLKSESFQQYQEDLRSAQIAATEGTKQFFFANPFVVALSVDGERGLKVALFATNVERKPKQFPRENSETNYLEVKTPTGQVLRVDMSRMMKPTEKHDGALAVGATRKWIGNVSDVLRDKEVEAPGRYVVTWVVEDTEVGSFTFVRPEPKPEPQPAPK